MTITNKNKLPLIIGGILVLLLIGVTALLVSEKKVNRELTQEFELEKEDLENQYTTFAKQYDELKLTVSNDSLSVLLEQEQLKTQRLLEELRTVKSTNAREIRRLRNELATLRKVMIGYINQIDSLNRLTAEQREIIADVTKKYNTASATINNLSQEKKALNQEIPPEPPVPFAASGEAKDPVSEPSPADFSCVSRKKECRQRPKPKARERKTYDTSTRRGIRKQAREDIRQLAYEQSCAKKEARRLQKEAREALRQEKRHLR